MRLVCLERSYAKIIFVVPILALCTALFFLLFLFWYPSLRKKFLYKETNLSLATHLFVEGTCKLFNDISVKRYAICFKVYYYNRDRYLLNIDVLKFDETSIKMITRSYLELHTNFNSLNNLNLLILEKHQEIIDLRNRNAEL